jgi:AcrR family transcriptional regulator
MGRRSEHSRDQIADMALEAASRLVQEHGLSGLSARRIAAEIGYTPGTLYLVFKNLDELILHLNGATLDALYQRLDTARAEDAGPADTILSVARAYLAFAQEQPRLWGTVFEHRLPEGERPPEWFLAKVERLFSLVESEVEKLPALGGGATAALAARALWSGVHGVCILSLSNKLTPIAPCSAEELVHSLVTGYLRGLAASK